MTDVIEIEGLTKTYGDFTAVNSLSLKIKKNSFVGFLGPNGAGKSTTIKMLTNLTSATSGTAFLNGIDVVKDPKGALTEVGAVVETPEFYPYLTPVKSLEYIARLRGIYKDDIAKRTTEVLELVKMNEEKNKKIGKFSKGMKQRVALAQALMFEPSILILDEPTSGLDPRGMVEVREILQDLRKEDITVFMSSHLLNETQDICDSVAMMNHGKLLIHSTIDDLRKGLETNRIEIKTICNVRGDLADSYRDISSVRGLEILSENQLVIDFKGDAEAKNLLLRKIDSELRVISFHESGNPLESLYLGMIKESR